MIVFQLCNLALTQNHHYKHELVMMHQKLLTSSIRRPMLVIPSLVNRPPFLTDCRVLRT